MSLADALAYANAAAELHVGTNEAEQGNIGALRVRAFQSERHAFKHNR